MAIRTCHQSPLKNFNFVGVSLALLVAFLLYLYEFAIREGSQLALAWIIITSFFYLMSIWSFITVAVTDPGKVPLFWGVYNSNPHQRKFCLVCHNFKPERAHHCSKCRQCVLNMDHHCPWINNCVGFYNRKYFILFLFYLLLTILVAVIQMVMIQIKEITGIVNGTRETDFHTALRFIVLIFCISLFVVLLMFFHMHVGMVLQNTTTLEVMVRDRKRKSIDNNQTLFDEAEDNPFDIDPWYNFTQVFGENACYWPVPLSEDQPLKGKGVFWAKKGAKLQDQYDSNNETLQAKPNDHVNHVYQ